MRLDSLLFGETQSRIVLAVAAENVSDIASFAGRHGAQATPIGTVGGGRLQVDVDGEAVISVAVDDLSETYETAIPRMMGHAVMSEG
jgi:phosphoribosylformylglycinamidine synthase